MSGTAFSDDWFKLYELYEGGKGRRYGLLFAVNGGAYALVSFLIGKDTPLSQLNAQAQWVVSALTIVIALVMIAYTLYMRTDIYEFGKKMRGCGKLLATSNVCCYLVAVEMDHRRSTLIKDPDLFGPGGQKHLKRVCCILIAAWFSAVVFAIVLQCFYLTPLLEAGNTTSAGQESTESDGLEVDN